MNGDCDVPDGEVVSMIMARYIIKQAIKDIASRESRHIRSAQRYVRSRAFMNHLGLAGYPVELRDTLLEMVLVSKPQRRYMRREILRVLEREWEKEKPLGKEGLQTSPE